MNFLLNMNVNRDMAAPLEKRGHVCRYVGILACPARTCPPAEGPAALRGADCHLFAARVFRRDRLLTLYFLLFCAVTILILTPASAGTAVVRSHI